MFPALTERYRLVAADGSQPVRFREFRVSIWVE
jgi:hypothetical protein